MKQFWRILYIIGSYLVIAFTGFVMGKGFAWVAEEIGLLDD